MESVRDIFECVLTDCSINASRAILTNFDRFNLEALTTESILIMDNLIDLVC